MRFILVLIVVLAGTSAQAWEQVSDTLGDGSDIYLAEVMGEGGTLLSVICDAGDVFVEALVPGLVADDQVDDALLFQVDQRPELLIAGFWDPVDDASAAFVGIDIRDRPATRTGDLLAQMKAGNALYLGDPDVGEAVERWSLRGSSKAITWVEGKCR